MKKWIKKNWVAGFSVIPAIIAFGFSIEIWFMIIMHIEVYDNPSQLQIGGLATNFPIHQFTNLKCCKMSFKAFKMKKQGLNDTPLKRGCKRLSEWKLEKNQACGQYLNFGGILLFFTFWWNMVSCHILVEYSHFSNFDVTWSF